MFQLVVAASIAFGAEAVDGIFKRSGSCTGGSCSAAPAQVVEAKPEPKTEVKAEKQATSCQGSSCSSARSRVGGRFFNRCK